MECERCFGNDFYFDSEGKRQNCDHSFDEPQLRNVALAMAQAIINGSRRDKYGDNSLPMVASLWSLEFFGEELELSTRENDLTHVQSNSELGLGDEA